MTAFSISVVTFEPDPTLLAACLKTLDAALLAAEEAGAGAARLTLIDHSPQCRLTLPALRSTTICELVHDPANPGFGAGHNRVLAKPEKLGELHLVLNPDAELAADALLAARAFMQAEPTCVLLSPAARDGAGQRQALCKRYPSVFDLALRGFAPGWLKQRFARRLARYEMHDVDPDRVHWDPPIVSGCFMLLRSADWRALGGFDEGFFLYFEDFDLSLRLAARGRLASVPAVGIVHHGGQAAHKGWRHILLFARSAWRFFNKHGWRWR